MHVQPSGDLLVDVVQGPFELERTMPRGQLRDDLAACHLQRGVQVGGAVAGIVVGGLLRGPWQQRQDRDPADQQPASAVTVIQLLLPQAPLAMGLSALLTHDRRMPGCQ
jgi:hypothetical protein